MAPSAVSEPVPEVIKGAKQARTSVNPLDPSVINLLDPEFVEYYRKNLEWRVPTHAVSIAESRQNAKKYEHEWCRDFSNENFVTNWTIPSRDGYLVPLRSYHPDPEVFGEGPYAVHVNYHGGGYVFGGLTDNAQWCMDVSKEVGIVVVDVDYRLCPENAFGKNTEDAWAALQWVSTHGKDLNIDAEYLSIGGYSAGGVLTCVLQHMARDSSPPIPLRLAMPAVPPVDDHFHFTKPSDSAYPSFSEMSRAPSLNWSRMSFFSKVLTDAGTIPEAEDWWKAPINAPNFKNLCRTFLITAECDPLRDEGEAYSRKVQAGGNLVSTRRYLGMPHPFGHLIELTQAKLYNTDTFNALREVHRERICHLKPQN